MRRMYLLALTGISLASISLVSCADDTTRTYRISSVGAPTPASDDNGGSGGNGGSGTGTSGSGNILVAGGNVLVGAASQFAALTGATNGLVPLGGTVNATVTAVLGNSGHTLVELGNGTSLLLNGNGGALGDVLSLDLASGRVIGGPAGSPLIGLNVLAANPISGSLATVNAASGNQLVGVTILDTALGGTGSGNNIVVAPAIAPALGLGATINGTVTAATGGLIGH